MADFGQVRSSVFDQSCHDTDAQQTIRRLVTCHVKRRRLRRFVAHEKASRRICRAFRRRHRWKRLRPAVACPTSKGAFCTCGLREFRASRKLAQLVAARPGASRTGDNAVAETKQEQSGRGSGKQQPQLRLLTMVFVGPMHRPTARLAFFVPQVSREDRRFWQWAHVLGPSVLLQQAQCGGRHEYCCLSRSDRNGCIHVGCVVPSPRPQVTSRDIARRRVLGE